MGLLSLRIVKQGVSETAMTIFADLATVNEIVPFDLQNLKKKEQFIRQRESERKASWNKYSRRSDAGLEHPTGL
jgi:hypothetical protein